MTTAVMKYELLTEILLPLADRFEAGDPHGFEIARWRTEQSELLKECVAELLDERWLVPTRLLNHYRLTEEGYRHFQPRLYALRTLQGASGQPSLPAPPGRTPAASES